MAPTETPRIVLRYFDARGRVQYLRAFLASRGIAFALDRTLDEWRWLETAAERPVMLADCLLWDQLRAARDVLGERLDLGATPRLERWLAEHPQRRAFEAVLEERPSPLTGHPSEAAALAKLREALDAA